MKCQVVSTIARKLRRVLESAHLRRALKIVAWASIAIAPNVPAGPQGETIVAGKGAITRPDARTTLIEQRSGRLAVDWRSFDVGKKEKVRFEQPSATASALNRVRSGSISTIRGQISSNGQVILVNPMGVMFSPTAEVNVGSLIASSLDLEVDDFMAGNYAFAASGDAAGMVANRGQVVAANGGLVALLGQSVANEGTITANVGTIALGAGRRAVFDFYGDGLVHFSVDGAVVPDASKALIDNSGELRADGGTVTLAAHVVKDIVRGVVNTSGVISAARVEEVGGEIRLVGRGADIEVSGRVSADGRGAGGGSIVVESDADTVLSGNAHVSASSPDGAGGSVDILGERVGVFDNAHVDVSGRTRGGAARIGGGFQGADPNVRNAIETVIGPNTTVTANATHAGNGGEIIAWSDGETRFDGHFQANGGPNGGDGGFVEVSGKRYLSFLGDVFTVAPLGKMGTLLLDPENIVIAPGTGDSDPATTSRDGTATFKGDDPQDPEGVLNGTDVAPSRIFKSEVEGAARTNRIILIANSRIDIDASLDLPRGGTFEADVVDGTGVTLTGGDREARGITITAATSTAAPGIVTTGSAPIQVTSPVISLTGNLAAGGGLTLAGAATAARSTTLSGRDVDIDAVTTTGGSDLSVTGRNSIVLGGDLAANSIMLDGGARQAAANSITMTADQTIELTGGSSVAPTINTNQKLTLIANSVRLADRSVKARDLEIRATSVSTTSTVPLPAGGEAPTNGPEVEVRNLLKLDGTETVDGDGGPLRFVGNRSLRISNGELTLTNPRTAPTHIVGLSTLTIGPGAARFWIGANTVNIESNGESYAQPAAHAHARIVADNLVLSGKSNFRLRNPNNNIETLSSAASAGAVGADTSGASVAYVDADTFDIGAQLEVQGNVELTGVQNAENLLATSINAGRSVAITGTGEADAFVVGSERSLPYTINGLGGDDTLTLNVDHQNLGADLTYLGGQGSNTLALEGTTRPRSSANALNDLVFNYTSASAGTIELTGTSVTSIEFSGLDGGLPLMYTGLLSRVEFNLPEIATTTTFGASTTTGMNLLAGAQIPNTEVSMVDRISTRDECCEIAINGGLMKDQLTLRHLANLNPNSTKNVNLSVDLGAGDDDVIVERTRSTVTFPTNGTGDRVALILEDATLGLLHLKDTDANATGADTYAIRSEEVTNAGQTTTENSILHTVGSRQEKLTLSSVGELRFDTGAGVDSLEHDLDVFPVPVTFNGGAAADTLSVSGAVSAANPTLAFSGGDTDGHGGQALLVDNALLAFENVAAVNLRDPSDGTLEISLPNQANAIGISNDGDNTLVQGDTIATTRINSPFHLIGAADGENQFTLEGLGNLDDTTITLAGGSMTDTFVVGGANTSNRTLGTNTLEIDGGPSGADVLTMEDSGTSGHDSYSLGENILHTVNALSASPSTETVSLIGGDFESITLRAGNGNDSATIDTELFAYPVVFEGGGQPSSGSGDNLTLVARPVDLLDIELRTPVAANQGTDGTLAIEVGTERRQIAYQGLDSPLAFSGAVTDARVTLANDVDNAVTLRPVLSLQGGLDAVELTGSNQMTSLSFSSPLNDLSLVGGNGDDTINLTGRDTASELLDLASNGQLTISGMGGDDTLVLRDRGIAGDYVAASTSVSITGRVSPIAFSDMELVEIDASTGSPAMNTLVSQLTNAVLVQKGVSGTKTLKSADGPDYLVVDRTNRFLSVNDTNGSGVPEARALELGGRNVTISRAAGEGEISFQLEGTQAVTKFDLNDIIWLESTESVEATLSYASGEPITGPNGRIEFHRTKTATGSDRNTLVLAGGSGNAGLAHVEVELDLNGRGHMSDGRLSVQGTGELRHEVNFSSARNITDSAGGSSRQIAFTDSDDKVDVETFASETQLSILTTPENGARSGRFRNVLTAPGALGELSLATKAGADTVVLSNGVEKVLPSTLGLIIDGDSLASPSDLDQDGNRKTDTITWNGTNALDVQSLTFLNTERTTLSGPLTLDALNVDASNQSLDVTGANVRVSQAVEFANTGDLNLGGNGAIQLYAGGFNTEAVATDPGSKVTLAGTFQSEGADITFDDVQLDGNVVVDMDPTSIGARAQLSFNDTLAKDSNPYSLQIKNSSRLAIEGKVQLGSLVVDGTNQTVDLFSEDLRVSGTTILSNTGELNLGSPGSGNGTQRYSGGLDAVNVGGSVTLRDTIQVDGTEMAFGSVSLDGSVTLKGAQTANDAKGTLVLGEVEEVSPGTGNLALRNFAHAAVGASGGVTLASLDVDSSNVDVHWQSSSSTVGSGSNANAPTLFKNTGELVLGQSGGAQRFVGGLGTTEVGGRTTLLGSFESEPGDFAFGEFTPEGRVTLDAVGGTLSIASIASSAGGTAGELELKRVVNTEILGDVALGALVVDNTNVDFTMTGDEVSINEGDGPGTAVVFENTGMLELGKSVSALTFESGLDATRGGRVAMLAGTFSTPKALAFSQVELSGDTGFVQATRVDVDAIDGASHKLTLSETTDVVISGDVSLRGIEAEKSAVNVALSGASVNVSEVARFDNTGTLMLGTGGGRQTYRDLLRADEKGVVSLAGTFSVDKLRLPGAKSTTGTRIETTSTSTLNVGGAAPGNGSNVNYVEFPESVGGPLHLVANSLRVRKQLKSAEYIHLQANSVAVNADVVANNIEIWPTSFDRNVYLGSTGSAGQAGLVLSGVELARLMASDTLVIGRHDARPAVEGASDRGVMHIESNLNFDNSVVLQGHAIELDKKVEAHSIAMRFNNSVFFGPKGKLKVDEQAVVVARSLEFDNDRSVHIDAGKGEVVLAALTTGTEDASINVSAGKFRYSGQVADGETITLVPGEMPVQLSDDETEELEGVSFDGRIRAADTGFLVDVGDERFAPLSDDFNLFTSDGIISAVSLTGALDTQLSSFSDADSAESFQSLDFFFAEPGEFDPERELIGIIGSGQCLPADQSEVENHAGCEDWLRQ